MLTITAVADFIDEDEPVGTTRVYLPPRAPQALVRATARYALQQALRYQHDETLENEGYEFAPEGPIWGEDGDGKACWLWSWGRFDPNGGLDYRD